MWPAKQQWRTDKVRNKLLYSSFEIELFPLRKYREIQIILHCQKNYKNLDL